MIKFLSQQNPADILCLGARTGSMADTLNTLENEYPDIFNKRTVFASIQERDSSGATVPSPATAIFTTYDSSKGLERPICAVFDYTESYWKVRVNKPQQSYEILRNIFCVAASRGKYRIIFVTTGEEQLSIQTSEFRGCIILYAQAFLQVPAQYPDIHQLSAHHTFAWEA